MRARTLSSALIRVDLLRVLQHGFHIAPAIAFQPAEEAARMAGVTGDAARLLDQQQDRIGVAVDANLAHPLRVSRRLTLVPQLRPRARPVMRTARLARARQR